MRLAWRSCFRALGSLTKLTRRRKSRTKATAPKSVWKSFITRTVTVQEINTRPFKDLLASAKKMKDDGKLKLTGQIELTVESDLDSDGKLKNAHVTDKRGDKILESVALDFVAALSDSGVLDFLEGTTHV